MTKLTDYVLIEKIIGLYHEVYHHTLRSFPAHIYALALREELEQQGIPTDCPDNYPITYKNHPVGLQPLNLFLAEDVTVESKVVNQLTRLHKVQAVSYLKAVDKRTGLLLNFGGSEPVFERIYFNPAKKSPISPSRRYFFALAVDWRYPDLADEIVDSLHEIQSTLGPGFALPIYINACWYELELRGLAVEPIECIQVDYKAKAIGEIALTHLFVDNRIMIFPVTAAQVPSIRLDNLRQWLALSKVQLGILANFDAAKLDLTFIKV